MDIVCHMTALGPSPWAAVANGETRTRSAETEDDLVLAHPQTGGPLPKANVSRPNARGGRTRQWLDGSRLSAICQGDLPLETIPGLPTGSQAGARRPGGRELVRRRRCICDAAVEAG
jgi:hypothetical protein